MVWALALQLTPFQLKTTKWYVSLTYISLEVWTDHYNITGRSCLKRSYLL